MVAQFPPDLHDVRHLRLKALLLLVWAVVSFGAAYFARDLNFTFFGWPFSFWAAAQGSLIVYVVIIWFYARYMNQLDQEHGLAEIEED